MKILFLIAAVGHFSHGGKSKKNVSVHVFAPQALYRDLTEAAKLNCLRI